MVFQRKKIQIETLAEYLSAVRLELGLSLDEVAKASGVNIKFLEMLEQGSFSALPPVIYVVGFLRKISLVYKIESEPIISQYKKEESISKNVHAESMLRKGLDNFSGLVVTPKLLGISALISFVVLTTGYLMYEVKSVNQEPSVIVSSPQDGSRVLTPVVLVAGMTDYGNQLSVNGKDVSVSETGEFETTVSVGSGQTILHILARNKFNKVTERTVSVIGDVVSGSPAMVPYYSASLGNHNNSN